MKTSALALIALVAPLAALSSCNSPQACGDQLVELGPSFVPSAASQPFFQDPPRWRPLFQGIDHAELATDKPRDLVVQALRIDSSAPGLELFTTPSNGDKPLETDGQTTRAFLEEHGLAVAINTHFFDPCCNRIPGEAKDLIGLSIAQGLLVSPNTDQSQRDVFIFEAGIHDDASFDAILLADSQLDQLASYTPTHAIAGRVVLDHGQLIDGDDRFSTTQHPRTLVGLGERYNYLYLVTIDGRQPGYSKGASLAEAAAIMARIGASMALNVDGGGSTTMVLRDPDGASQLVNSPSGGGERIVGSNLGFRALPLQPAVPSDP